MEITEGREEGAGGHRRREVSGCGRRSRRGEGIWGERKSAGEGGDPDGKEGLRRGSVERSRARERSQGESERGSASRGGRVLPVSRGSLGCSRGKKKGGMRSLLKENPLRGV